tara:strand:- start:413 stop:1000 length:588 start_codon:yes stop_codon:yes gene_type:complete
MLKNLFNNEKGYLNRALYKRHIEGNSELNRYIEKYFSKNNKITNYDNKLLQSQKNIIEYFDKIIIEKLENVCDSENITNISWEDITSIGINIMYNHLIDNNLYRYGINPSINSFMTLFEKIKSRNINPLYSNEFDNLLKGPKYCHCDNSNNSQDCYSTCSIISVCIAIILIKNELKENKENMNLNICGNYINFIE